MSKTAQQVNVFPFGHSVLRLFLPIPLCCVYLLKADLKKGLVAVTEAFV